MPIYCDGRPCTASSLIENQINSMVNKTGSASVKGTIVRASTTVDNAFETIIANGEEPIGIVFDNGIPDGSYCRIVTGGKAQVLLKNSTASTRGNWVKVSDSAGRADATLTDPPGSGIPEHDQHFTEIGHCMESKTSGTDVLAWCMIHFN